MLLSVVVAFGGRLWKLLRGISAEISRSCLLQRTQPLLIRKLTFIATKLDDNRLYFR